MTIELIRQARERLEQLRAESTPGEWVAGTSADHHDGDMWAGNRLVATFHRVSDKNSYAHVDMDLILSLHRTIDAQIQILKNAEWRYNNMSSEVYKRISTNELALAKAIMGVE